MDYFELYEKIFTKYTGNAVINGTKKLFLRTLADQIEQWCQFPAFTVTPQTVSALTTTLCAHAMLIEDLLNEAYQYVTSARL